MEEPLLPQIPQAVDHILLAADTLQRTVVAVAGYTRVSVLVLGHTLDHQEVVPGQQAAHVCSNSALLPAVHIPDWLLVVHSLDWLVVVGHNFDLQEEVDHTVDLVAQAVDHNLLEPLVSVRIAAAEGVPLGLLHSLQGAADIHLELNHCTLVVHHNHPIE